MLDLHTEQVQALRLTTLREALALLKVAGLSWICSKISLRRHIESVHEGKTYHCQHCEQKCANGGSLKRHIQSIYEGKTFQCQHCDQNYTERCSLKTHIQSVYKGTGLKVLKVAKEMMNL